MARSGSLARTRSMTSGRRSGVCVTMPTRGVTSTCFKGCNCTEVCANREPTSAVETTAAFLKRRPTPLKKRSEERRVGKECRSWWSPYHYKILSYLCHFRVWNHQALPFLASIKTFHPSY